MDSRNPYEVLGIEKSASTSEIRKAYIKLAFRNHPDKGGDPEKFKTIAWAYHLLMDPDRRAFYDQRGEDKVNQDTNGLIAMQLCNCLMQILTTSGSFDWSTKDLVNAMKTNLEEQLRHIDMMLTRSNDDLRRMKDIRKRFSTKAAFDPIGGQLNAMIESIIKSLKHQAEEKRIIKLALVHLETYSFKHKKPDQPTWQSVVPQDFLYIEPNYRGFQS